MSSEFLDHGNSTDEDSDDFPVDVLKETPSEDLEAGEEFQNCRTQSNCNIVSFFRQFEQCLTVLGEEWFE